MTSPASSIFVDAQRPTLLSRSKKRSASDSLWASSMAIRKAQRGLARPLCKDGTRESSSVDVLLQRALI